MTALAPMAEGLHDWARKRAVHLADEFMRTEDGNRDPVAFFNATLARDKLLEALRNSAEPAFMARITELEADHG